MPSRNPPILDEIIDVLALRLPPQHMEGHGRQGLSLCARAIHEYRRLVRAPVLHEDTQIEQVEVKSFVSADSPSAGFLFEMLFAAVERSGHIERVYQGPQAAGSYGQNLERYCVVNSTHLQSIQPSTVTQQPTLSECECAKTGCGGYRSPAMGFVRNPSVVGGCTKLTHSSL